MLSDCDSQPAFRQSTAVQSEAGNADNLKGVKTAEENMMKELKDYATEGHFQLG